MHKKYKNFLMIATLLFTGQSFGQEKPVINPAPRATSGLKPCAGEVRVDPPTYLALGKSRVIRLDFPAARMLIGGQSSSRAGRAVAPNDKAPPGTPGNAPAAAASSAQGSDGVADLEITLLSPRELFFLGKKAGSMNVVLQSAEGRCVVKDIIVTIDPDTLQSKLTELMPEETGIKVKGAENTIVLTGKVSDAIKLDEVLSLAGAYGDGKKIVNMLRIMTPQQVMLEVKIAEVSKTLLDRFGIDYSRLLSTGNSARFLSGIFGGGPAIIGKLAGELDFAGSAGTGFGGPLGRVGAILTTPLLPPGLPPRSGSANLLGIEAQKRDGLIRILAEPNIMAISGQSASFLSGGRIFIPVAQTREGGGNTISLEEKEFGVGLKFLPTVLDGTRINLKLVSEVSELAQTGSAFTTVGGVTSVLPSITSRRVDTTVQLNDGQSFAIAGLIKNNVTESVSRFPGVGEVPVLGTLFRSTEFQNDQTELLFVITPRLVKPSTTAITLPTDNHVVPSRSEVILNGATESARPAQSIPVNPATN